MFYKLEIEDYIRVEPELFGLETREAVLKQLEKTYYNYSDKELGAVVGILNVLSVGEGIIIPGDGAAYYKTDFELLAFKPELQELIFGEIDEITNFGALVNIGAMRGMLHISQAMDDFVNFSKTNILIGKNSRRSLKKGDLCLARIVAISYKTTEQKIGLTMRQPGLGKLEWIEEDKRKAKSQAEKLAKEEKAEAKSKKK
jgi:DNA-directed RNA polymerase subunit E'